MRLRKRVAKIEKRLRAQARTLIQAQCEHSHVEYDEQYGADVFCGLAIAAKTCKECGKILEMYSVDSAEYCAEKIKYHRTEEKRAQRNLKQIRGEVDKTESGKARS